MIALIDANNFYVSCERIFNLSLTGKPVAVLSNNDGCVISRSQEFKALGIAMGTPYFQLREWVSSGAITLCSSNYELYGDISRRIVDILGGFSADVEPYSIDEAFVHFPDTPGVDRFALGKAIRERLLKWIGIPCGVGFAPSRTLAKIANHIGKKSESGIFVMPDDPTPILAELPVSEVWGIGRRLEPKLTRIGIQTAAQLAAADPVEIRRRFSVTVAQTVLELRGQSVIRHENPEAAAQSISCSRSFGHPVTAFDELAESVAHYLATAARKLRQQRQCAAGVTIYLQLYPEYRPFPLPGGFPSTLVTFDTPTAATGEMIKAVLPKLKGLFVEGRRYKKSGVVFFGLEPMERRQEELFEDHEKSRRNEKLYAVVDRINQRYGRNTLFSLAEGIDRPWAMKREFLSPCSTTRWEQLPTVR